MMMEQCASHTEAPTGRGMQGGAIILGSSLPRPLRARLARIRCGDRSSSASVLPVAGAHHEYPYKAHMGSEWLYEMIADMGFGDASPAAVLFTDERGLNHRTLDDAVDVLKAFAATSPTSTGSIDKSLLSALMFSDADGAGRRAAKRDPFARTPRVAATRCNVPRKYYLQQAQPRALCH